MPRTGKLGAFRFQQTPLDRRQIARRGACCLEDCIREHDDRRRITGLGCNRAGRSREIVPPLQDQSRKHAGSIGPRPAGRDSMRQRLVCEPRHVRAGWVRNSVSIAYTGSNHCSLDLCVCRSVSLREASKSKHRRQRTRKGCESCLDVLCRDLRVASVMHEGSMKRNAVMHPLPLFGRERTPQRASTFYCGPSLDADRNRWHPMRL